MAYIKLLSILITVLVIFFIDEIVNASKFRQSKVKLLMHRIVDVTPQNPYIDILEAYTYDKEYITVMGKIKKELPKTSYIQSVIAFSGMDLPDHIVLVCDSFHEKVFGEDVAHYGFPVPGFPLECPVVEIDKVGVKDYQFNHERLDPNTPAGPITVNVTVKYEDLTMIKVNLEAEIVHEIMG